MTRLVAHFLLPASLIVGGCAPPPARDVILVTLDTTRADHLGCYGADPGSTPALDALAAKSAIFTEASCQVPITTPSHATILTGLLPPAHGVRDNGTFALPDTATTLGERLAEHGFATHAVIASFALDRRFGLAQGFAGYDDVLGKTGGPRAERTATEVVDRAIAWLAETPGPAFLWVHLYDPHHPYEPPAPFASRFPGRPYAGEIAYMDHELGRLFTALEGRWSDALIVVVSDHGESLGEHGERFHGTLLYEATLRVPLLIKWPGGAPRGRVGVAAGTHDLVPTILAAVGLPADPSLPGRDLRPLAAGASEPGRGIYAESLTAELHYGWARLTALRTERFKLISGTRDELYDHTVDHGETKDLSALEEDVTAGLRADLSREATDFASRPSAIDPHAAEMLAALGYVSAGGSSAGARAIDPAGHIELENLVLDALDLEPRDPQAAARRYEGALRGDPAMKLPLLRLAMLEERSGNVMAALGHYRTVCTQYPDVELASAAAARLLVYLGRLDEARELVEASLLALPRSDALRLDLAAISRRGGDNERARQLALAVDPTGPHGARASYVLATVEAATGNAPEAARWVREAVGRGLEVTPLALEQDPAFATIKEAAEYHALLEWLPGRR